MSNTPKSDKEASWGTSSGDASFSGTHAIMHPNGPTSFEFGKNESSFKDSIDGCSNDFGDNKKRGYANRKDDPRDVEVRVIAEFSGIQSGEHFSIGGPTGHHPSGNNHCCQGYSYMISTEITDNPTRWRFRKETTHPNYQDSPEGYFKNTSLANFKISGLGRNVGIGYCRYNAQDNQSVFLEAWFNPNPDADPENWTMIRKIEDKSGKHWTSEPGACGGDKDQIGIWSNCHVRLKTNSSGGTIDFKHIIVREIDPFGKDSGTGDGTGGTPNPPPPPDTGGTLSRQFRDIFNINSSPAQSCSGLQGGVLPFVLVYDEHSGTTARTLVDDPSTNNRIRVTEKIITGDTSSRLFGKKPRQVLIPMKKLGSPGGNVTCAIWDNAADPIGGNKVVEIGVIAVNTLDTSFKEVSFYNEAAPLSLPIGMQKGWSIGIEYLGTDASNNIQIERNDADPIDGGNTIYCSLEKDATTGNQKLVNISKADVTMKIYT